MTEPPAAPVCVPDQATAEAHPSSSPPPFSRDDLWRAVDELTNPSRRKLVRDDGMLSYTEHITVPSLWDQLLDAMESGSGGQSRAVPGSKPPLDAASLSLMVSIATDIAESCREYGLKRRHDNPKDLRQIASHAVRTSPDHIHFWTWQIRAWCGQIRAACSSDPDRPTRLHGMACPDCRATSVPETQIDGTEVRAPAMQVSWHDKQVRAIECRMCGQVWFRGQDIDKLVARIMGTDSPAPAIAPLAVGEG